MYIKKNINYIMKPSFFILAATMCSLLFFTSCENKEDAPSLNVATGVVIVSSGGGPATFALTSANTTWNVVSDKPWCTVSPASGTGDAIVSVMVDAYLETTDRSATVTVSDGKTTFPVVIKQTGANSILAIAPTMIAVGDTASSSAEIYLRSNTSWSTSIVTTATDVNWCTLSEPWGTGDDTLTVICTPNISSDIRTATITFAAGSVTQRVTVTQAPNPAAFRVSPTSLFVDEGSQETISVFCDGGTWTAAVGSEGHGWCTIAPATGSGNGQFVVTITGAVPSTLSQRTATITVTSAGVTKEISVTQAHYLTDTRDNKKYRIVLMPDNRWWMAENLAFTKDLVFNPDPEKAHGAVSAHTARGIDAIGSYWAPGAPSATSSTTASIAAYGALYTWETVLMVDGKWSDDTKSSSVWDDTWITPYFATTGNTTANANTNSNRNNGRGATGRGICPPGWHVPTQMEWATLMDLVDGDGTGSTHRNYAPAAGSGMSGTDAGKKMKSANICPSTETACNTDENPAWNYHATNAGIDTYGFSATPAGYSIFQSPAAPLFTPSAFLERGVRSIYWTCTPGTSFLNTVSRAFVNNEARAASQNKATSNALSVRCIKD